MPRKAGTRAKRPKKRGGHSSVTSDDTRNAITLLKEDHREVEALFKTFKKARSAAEKQSVAARICTALKLHMLVEEEIFYPAFVAATHNEALCDEAVVEHDAAKKLIEDIEHSRARDPLLDAKVNVLSEMIKHHVKEEERFTGMFVEARVARMDLRKLGMRIQARKQDLRAPQRPRARRARSALVGAAALAHARAGRTPSRRAAL